LILLGAIPSSFNERIDVCEVATVALFGFDTGGRFFWVAAIAGLICTAEEIAITLTLDTWTCDVLSIAHARRLQAQRSIQ
jgi:CDP-diacylglycerol--glycerol-3-phosphate 3-phosphatidyltransferase